MNKNIDSQDIVGLGEKIKHFREGQGLSQSKFSKILNIDQSLLSLYENEKRPIPIFIIKKIIAGYSLRPEIFLGEGSPYIQFIDDDQLYSSSVSLESPMKTGLNLLKTIYDANNISNDDKILVLQAIKALADELIKDLKKPNLIHDAVKATHKSEPISN